MSQTSVEATNAILQADLTPIEHKLLVGFIEQAVSPDVAASEVLRRVRSGRSVGLSVEETLREFKRDWGEFLASFATAAQSEPGPVHHAPAFRDVIYRRDQARCCVKHLGRAPGPSPANVEPPEPTFILPPSLVHTLEDTSRSLVDAFLTPSGVTQLRTILLDTSEQGMLANTMLLTPSVSYAFRNSHLQASLRSSRNRKKFDQVSAEGASRAEYSLSKLYPEPYEDIRLSDGYRFDSGYCVLQTEDPKQLPLPSPFLIRTHHQFASALHHFRIEERIVKEGLPQHSSFPGPYIQLMARNVWLLLPKFIRAFCYRRLLKRGKVPFTRGVASIVYQLPLGLYAKRCGRRKDCQHNEPETLQLLEQEAPSIPAPRLVDIFQTSAADGGDDWFIMTGLPGVPVRDILHRMSYPERHQLADDLRIVLDRMHRIPNKTPYLIGSVVGGRIFDPRATSARGCGPFKSEVDFNAHLSRGFEEVLYQRIPTAFSKTHKAVFTHSDFFLGNILVNGGRLSGIVDWEFAGFMPEYWEFTKAMWTMMNNKDAHAIYRRIWDHKFDEELETEQLLWLRFPFGGPEPDDGGLDADD